MTTGLWHRRNPAIAEVSYRCISLRFVSGDGSPLFARGNTVFSVTILPDAWVSFGRYDLLPNERDLLCDARDVRLEGVAQRWAYVENPDADPYLIITIDGLDFRESSIHEAGSIDSALDPKRHRLQNSDSPPSWVFP